MEKSSSSKVIEVTVISAQDLLLNRKRPAKKVSITVKTDPINARSTSMDTAGGNSPTWNEKLVMELPGIARYITVEARSGSKVIGSANIAVSEFYGSYLRDNHLSFLSYRLRSTNGEKNGIVNLSVKVKGSENSGYAASCSHPWMGVPAVDCKASGGGVVMGIPVSYRY